MTKDTALRMAIEAMKYHTEQTRPIEGTNQAIQACKDALEQPAQEPVAWMNDIAFSMDKELLGTRSRIVPLYTTPPSHDEWIRRSEISANMPLVIDCRTCANKGVVRELSQESYCESCIHSTSWMRNYYEPIKETTK